MLISLSKAPFMISLLCGSSHAISFGIYNFVVINTFKKYKIIVIEVLMIQEVILSKIP
jgi:hypothetical protein